MLIGPIMLICAGASIFKITCTPSETKLSEGITIFLALLVALLGVLVTIMGFSSFKIYQ